MPLTLPRLDDRRWSDLVEEGRALLPLHAPAWTDHNLHDPGVTLLELFAWLTEQDLYRVDRVTEDHRLRFLELLGIVPRPARGARAVVSLHLADDGGGPLELPAGLVLHAHRVGGGGAGAVAEAGERRVPFLTLHPVTAVAAVPVAVQSVSGGAFRDLTRAWRGGEVLAPFGADPRPGDAFYLGLDPAPPADEPLSLHVRVAGADDAEEEETRRRLAAAAGRDCAPPRPHCEGECRCGGDCGRGDDPGSGCGCGGGGGGAAPGGAVGTGSHDPAAAGATPPRPVPPHHSARVVWEMAVATGSGPVDWRTLDPAAGEVEDPTRSLTLSGRVLLHLPEVPATVRLGEVDAPLAYLRCRFAGGAFDAAPRWAAVVWNAVVAQQVAPATATWPVAPDAVLEGDPPQPGHLTRLAFAAVAGGPEPPHLTRLATGDAAPADAADVWVLDWRPPGTAPPAAGSLTVELVPLGAGTGRPGQAADLTGHGLAGGEVALWSAEPEAPAGAEADAGAGDAAPTAWRRWRRQAHFGASRRGDAHFLLDTDPRGTAPGEAPTNRVRLGDGEAGRTAPEGSTLAAAFAVTLGAAGGVDGGPYELADVARNRALLAADGPGLEAIAARLAGLAAPRAASGGRDAEAPAAAERRALEAAASHDAAVTLADLERLARATPGTRVARAEARGELHPALPCHRAPGVTSVFVLPRLPAVRPWPSAGLLARVRAHLAGRRVLGSRIEVAGPTYVPVAVRARVRACPGVDGPALARRLAAALDAFFHPLTGGPARPRTGAADGEGRAEAAAAAGWPFGRAVYASEVYQVLDGTDGADHVLSLELVCADGEAHCGNLCLPPDGLPEAGEHEITVEGGEETC